MAISLVTALSLAGIALASPLTPRAVQSCDTIEQGYQCQPEISHSWGQYSPFFSVPSNLSTKVPDNCKVSFVQVLSRHGARDPTASKTASYNKTVIKLKASAKNLTGKYAFLRNYSYTLGADQLTKLGEQEMVNSGIKFFNAYPRLSRHSTPFVRSASESRVVVSGQNWTQGFHNAKARAVSDSAYPYPVVVISEDATSNNTLNHGLCDAFENGPAKQTGAAAQATFTNIFVPPIQKRINADLGANLTTTEIIYLMELCPFETVAAAGGAVSPWCALFTTAEFKQYDYYATLGKYYGYGGGNKFGPTNGVGFTNELIARLTRKPVVDSTSTNRTLDGNPATFPLDRRVYADFSHDNDMTGILFAMGVFDGLEPLSNTTVDAAAYYTAASTVPFAGRIIVEKHRCESDDVEDDDDGDDNDDDEEGGDDEGDDDDDDDGSRHYRHRRRSDKGRGREQEELVRVIVNDRVLPLRNCGADQYGRCTVAAYVQSLGFARSGGLWSQCFATGRVVSSLNGTVKAA